jgi:hypothetical protein
MRYEQALEKAGMTEESASTAVKKAIKKVTDLREQIDLLNEEIEGASEEEKPNILKKIGQAESALEDAEDNVVKKIEAWERNKDVYASNAARLAAARAKKGTPKKDNQNPPQPAKVPNPDLPSVAATIETPNPAINPGQMPQYNQGGVVAQSVKKNSDNSVWWIIAGFVAIATFGTVIMRKNE